MEKENKLIGKIENVVSKVKKNMARLSAKASDMTETEKKFGTNAPMVKQYKEYIAQRRNIIMSDAYRRIQKLIDSVD